MAYLNFDFILAGPFGFDGKALILLLCGGNKREQSRDINLAEALWEEYLARSEK
jgi:hypothetical protein